MVAAIVWLSLTPSPPQVPLESGDKLGHFAAYGVLMLWFAQLHARRLPWAAGFLAMGIGLEFVQAGLGYRTLEVLDMAANAAGVLAGWGTALLLKEPILR